MWLANLPCFSICREHCSFSFYSFLFPFAHIQFLSFLLSHLSANSFPLPLSLSLQSFPCARCGYLASWVLIWVTTVLICVSNPLHGCYLFEFDSSVIWLWLRIIACANCNDIDMGTKIHLDRAVRGTRASNVNCYHIHSNPFLPCNAIMIMPILAVVIIYFTVLLDLDQTP